jgi:hypothetical protein
MTASIDEFTSNDEVVTLNALLLPLGRLFLSLKTAMISSRGMALGKLHQAPRTVAARELWSESECHIFETVKPPRENARSASVDVAVYKLISQSKKAT